MAEGAGCNPTFVIWSGSGNTKSQFRCCDNPRRDARHGAPGDQKILLLFCQFVKGAIPERCDRFRRTSQMRFLCGMKIEERIIFENGKLNERRSKLLDI